MLKRIILVLSILLVLQVPGVFADGNYFGAPEDTGSLIDDLNDNLRKQEDLRNKIASARSDQESLSNDISYLENQIELTKLEIEETKNRLTQLAGDINEVSLQLDDTKDELEFTDKVANLRIQAIYKQSFISNFNQFLGADSFNDILIRQKYTEVIREQDLQLLAKLETLKKQIATQKTALEDKKKKEETLRADLETKTASLGTQQSSKQYTLVVTKNNEQTYRALLAQVQQEIVSIANLLGGGIRLGPVKRGEVIAFQGNTGCSSGTHTHFGLYIGGGVVNPEPYLNSGSLRWPVDNHNVTQWFGNVWSPAIGPHTGIDMQTGGGWPNRGYGSPIFAARDGVAYFSTDNGCPWIPGITGTLPGKWMKVVHSNGWVTIYGHVQ